MTALGGTRGPREEDHALHSGRVGFRAMEEVVFGRPAAEVVAEEARQRDAERVFMMASGPIDSHEPI